MPADRLNPAAYQPVPDDQASSIADGFIAQRQWRRDPALRPPGAGTTATTPLTARI